MDAIRKLLLRQAAELRLDMNDISEATPTPLIQARVMLGMRRLLKELDRLRRDEADHDSKMGPWIDRAAKLMQERDQARAERDELMLASATMSGG